MNEQGSIMSVKEYGQVSLKLRELMDSKSITRNYLARSVNTRFEVIDKWYKNDVENLDMDILARICFVLGCNIQDLLEYKPAQTEA